MLKSDCCFMTLLIILFIYPVTSKGQALFQEQLIFPLQNKHVHSSSMVVSPNGDLLVCWFHGSGERSADDVKIQGSRLKKGDSEWQPVFLMADTPGFPDCNPVMFIDQQQQLWLFWVTILAHRWEQAILKYRISQNYQNDGAPQWSWQDIITLKPGQVFADDIKDGFDKWAEETAWAEYAPPYTEMIINAARDPLKRQMGWMTRTHPVMLPNGRILLPLYSDGFCIGLVAISDDHGKSWYASRPMVGLGINQPSIVREESGTLVAYLRDEGMQPLRILKSVSHDDGVTWSYAHKTDIPNPSSSVEVIATKEMNWVMVFNDTEEGRHSLAVALSDDEGKTWKWKNHIARAQKSKKSFSYPSVIQTDDGLLHVTYSYSDGNSETIKYAVFNEEWIKKQF